MVKVIALMMALVALFIAATILYSISGGDPLEGWRQFKW